DDSRINIVVLGETKNRQKQRNDKRGLDGNSQRQTNDAASRNQRTDERDELQQPGDGAEDYWVRRTQQTEPEQHNCSDNQTRGNLRADVGGKRAADIEQQPMSALLQSLVWQ